MRGLFGLSGGLIAAAVLAVQSPCADAEELQTPHERVAPISVQPLFNPLPEMWGLRELNEDAKLEDLDESFVLYLSERARFKIGDRDGWVYLTRGKQFIVKYHLSDSDIADYLRANPCLCALEYESDSSAGELHTAAGAYRLTKAPSITEEEPRITRVEFEFLEGGQAGSVRLRKLLCWIAHDDTVMPLAATMPRFAMLTRKEHPGFRDPPVDDRPVQEDEIARQSYEDQQFLAMSDDYLGFQRGGGSRFEIRMPERWDAPELLGAAKPGLFTWLREIRTGRKLAIDYSDYYRDCDPYIRSLDRRQGIYYRDPAHWP